MNSITASFDRGGKGSLACDQEVLLKDPAPISTVVANL
jgi:hypothetical protein